MQIALPEQQQGPAPPASPHWVHHVIALLNTAIDGLDREQAAHGAILKATSLLRRQVGCDPEGDPRDEPRERLLAWQVRRVIEHIDSCLTTRVLVADLSALVQRSEAHFSRSFRATFGLSPHAFVIRRRIERASQYMLQTDAALSDIALRCGFVDQAHLCKHFRTVTGETPAAWRRSRRMP